MEPVVAAIIGVITAIAANIVVEVFGWKKVGQRIGKSEKPLSLQNQEIAKTVVNVTGVSNNDKLNLSLQHEKIESLIKEDLISLLNHDIKPQIGNINDYVKIENANKERLTEILTPTQLEINQTIEKLADFSENWKRIIEHNAELSKEVQSLNIENKLLLKENNDLKNAMPSIDAGWQYDNPQGRGRSR